jgi:MFS family permease
MGRSFRGLWFAAGSANLADGVALLVLPLLAVSAGASPGGVAAVTTVATLAWPVFGLHAGWIVDRVSRRALLAAVNAARGGVFVAVAAAVAVDALSLPLILATAAIYGVAETLVDTALTATVPALVPVAGRGRANARIEATINLTNQLAGPMVGGLLAGVGLAVASGASAALYLAAIAGIAVMRLPARGTMASPGPVDPPRADDPPATRTRLIDGVRHLWRDGVLRSLTLFTAAMNVVWAGWTALFVLYAVAPGPLGLSTAQYGVLLSAMAVGGLLASATVEPLRRRFGTARLLMADCVGTILLVAPVAVGAGVPWVAAGAVVAGAGSSIWRILLATIRQNRTPAGLLGRVYAASRVISWGVLPGGAAAAGLVAELWDVRTGFVVGTGVAIVVAVTFILVALRYDLDRAAAAQAEPAAAPAA